MKTVFKLLLVAVLFTSCGEADTAIYKGNADSDQTLLSFAQNVYSLPIEVDNVGSVDVVINSSTKSDADRVYTISTVAEGTTADPATYNVPTTVTIPAGSYQGVLTITGQDEGLEESTVLILELTANDGEILPSNRITVNVQQVCPVDESLFVGQYLIQETTPYVDGPTLDHGAVVNVTIPTGDNRLRRQFTTRNYINYCTTTTMSFKFALVCGEVIVDAGQTSTCTCNGALTFGPATTPSPYDVSDDSVFFVTFTNDETMDCGSTTQTTYKFTKQ